MPFPTFPRFCGQTFYEDKDKELGLACVKANNDWMVEEWCAPSGGVNIPLCLIPLWDAELAAAETRRNAERGVRAIAFSEIPTRLELPSINTDYWDPLWQVCNDYGVTVCMHVGSSSSNPVASPDSQAAVGVTLGFNNAMASLADWLFSGNLIRFPKLKLAYSEGQIGWIPYVLERADTVWEMHDSWTHAKERIPVPPSTQYYGRIFGCFTADRHGLRSLEEVGEDNICFETDYPHTDTTWPYSEAYIEKLVRRPRRRAGLQDPARQRHQDAGARPGLTVVAPPSVDRTIYEYACTSATSMVLGRVVAGGRDGVPSRCAGQRHHQVDHDLVGLGGDGHAARRGLEDPVEVVLDRDVGDVLDGVGVVPRAHVRADVGHVLHLAARERSSRSG